MVRQYLLRMHAVERSGKPDETLHTDPPDASKQAMFQVLVFQVLRKQAQGQKCTTELEVLTR